MENARAPCEHEQRSLSFSSVVSWSSLLTLKLDPLAEECSGACLGNYRCYSENGKAPGICVPPCTRGAAACPATYACAESLGVCVPAKDLRHEAASSNCALGFRRKPQHAFAWTALLVAFGLVARRRKKDA